MGRENDCLSCRLVSGGGLFCAGIYVIRSARKSSVAEKLLIGLFGSGLIGLGVARLLVLPPFQHRHLKNQSD